MEALTDLITLMNDMNNRERKSAKKHFARHYKNTKELRLFNIVEMCSLKKNMNFNYQLKKLGYNNVSSRSFMKLKVRLKNKIIEYLSSTNSISETKKHNENAYLCQKIRKLNLQAQILIEKSHFDQAYDVINFSIRLSKENRLYYETLDALNQLKGICSYSNEFLKREKIEKRIKKYEQIYRCDQELNDELYKVRSLVQLHSIDNPVEKISDIARQMEEKFGNINIPNLTFASDYFNIYRHLLTGEFYKSIAITMKWIRKINAQPSCFQLNQKVLIFISFFENLHYMGKRHAFQKFIDSELIENLPSHFKIQFEILKYQFNTLSLKNDLNPVTIKINDDLLDQPTRSEDQLHLIYLRAIEYFQNNKIKPAIKLINDNIGLYPSSSMQKLDLMVMEMMCYYENGPHDLLEYKTLSYSKNLAYRDSFILPEYYFIFHRIINVLIKIDRPNAIERLVELMEKFNSSVQNIQFQLHSIQPVLFYNWVTPMVEKLQSAKPGHIEELSNNSSKIAAAAPASLRCRPGAKAGLVGQ